MAKLIYLADDEENIRVLMKAFLENEGYAGDGFFRTDPAFARHLKDRSPI